MSDPDDAIEQRVIELETRLAEFEAMADELSAVVADQGRAIDRLEALLRAATDRLEEMSEGLSDPADDRPPPHY